MLTEVMRYYELARAPVDLGYFETEHHTQLIRDLRASIAGGRLIALTAVIGAGKTLLVRRLRDELEREGRVIVSRSLTLERSKVTVPLLVTALLASLSNDGPRVLVKVGPPLLVCPTVLRPVVLVRGAVWTGERRWNCSSGCAASTSLASAR